MQNKFFNELYTFIPISVGCGISNTAVEQALIQLDYDIKQGREYNLYIHKNDLRYIQNIVDCPLKITVEIDKSLSPYSWYLIDSYNKKLVYSPSSSMEF